MKCPGCGKHMLVGHTISEPEDKHGVIERVRYMKCVRCDYTQKHGEIKDVWYLSRDKVWLCEF